MAASVEELIRMGSAALARGDVAAFFESIDDNVVVHVPGRSSLAGDWHGKAKFIETFSAQAQATGGRGDVPHAILTDGEHGIVLAEIRFPDGSADRQVIVQHIRGGKVVEIWVYSSDQYRFDERLASAGL
jgi:ketosteroid isomerase-like protein